MPTGLTKDAGWQIGVSRTLPHPPFAVWDFVSGPEGLALWLGPSAHLTARRAAPYRTAAGEPQAPPVRCAGPSPPTAASSPPADPQNAYCSSAVTVTLSSMISMANGTTSGFSRLSSASSARSS